MRKRGGRGKLVKTWFVLSRSLLGVQSSRQPAKEIQVRCFAGQGETLPSSCYEKIAPRLQNKHHPEPSENQGVWKSDNQGFKETTLIQMGRIGRDMERGVERHRVTEVAQRSSGTGGPHAHMW